ncbi:Hypothetical protein PHPALM_19815 [Phytophthora palmivora]|uniref:FAD-binding FR-type domain-containing protein n=1 Tax=Phytophthora palmivora TaxID=4796 RepID=A0A2P4XGG0_9STRA|nr:Hypothetical protein PHPALM_19815 [Phytophthora palmivora]
MMKSATNVATTQSLPVVPILQDSVWSDPCSWDDSDESQSGDATANADVFILAEPIRTHTTQSMQSWLRLRWQLSRRLFSVPIHALTMELGLKTGDFVLTIPVILILVVVSAVQATNGNVKGSGTPPSIGLGLVFVFVVRNNSLLVALTGISFERALFYHKCFAFVTIILTGLHGLAYALKRNDGILPQSPKVASGMIAFIAMVVLYLLSLECIRRRFHEFFVRTHWILFIVILVAAVLHGSIIALVGILPWEIDLIFRLVYRSRVYSHGTIYGSHPRELSNELFILGSSETSCKMNHQRLGVAAQDQIEIFQLPGDITCIQFPRVRLDTGEEFNFKAGQYEFVTFHIKAVGDWTMKLLQAAPETRTDDGAPFEVLLDGPYGNLSIDIEDSTTYSHFVFFAGGMGVTPLRAIANWLHGQCHLEKARILHRLRFVWSVSDVERLQALMSLDDERWLNNPRAPYLPDVLLCPTTLNVSTETFFTEIYLTRGLVGSQTQLDPQLRKCLWFHCRPDIEQILREMGHQAVKHGNSRIAVLVCGPQSMETEVIATSLKLSKEMELHFDVHSEHYAF